MKVAKQVTLMMLRKGVVAKATIRLPKFLVRPMRTLMWCADFGPFHLVTQTVRWNEEMANWDLWFAGPPDLRTGEHVRVINGAFAGERGSIFAEFSDGTPDRQYMVDFFNGGNLPFAASELERINQ